MKYLFLDFDGVLNNAATFRMRDDLDKIEPAKVALLNDIDACIVISSAWREHHSVRELKQVLARNGLHDADRVIDQTPVLNDCPRGNEIQAWLDAHHVTSSQIAILDDVDDMLHLTPRLVLTDMADGLLPVHIQRVNELLTLGDGAD
jgi:HAD domain in Swiss Army Knife RNA repair proteins